MLEEVVRRTARWEAAQMLVDVVMIVKMNSVLEFGT